jgi:hypothetical protein
MSSAIIEDQLHKHYDRISPGVVGSVGDVNVGVRLKHSSPDMPLRYQEGSIGYESQRYGSNVQDGTIPSYDSKGYGARVVDSSWGSGRSFKTSHGWVSQDLRAADRIMEPVLGATPRYTWYNKIARVVEAKRTGEHFLPLPGAYEPTSTPRGGQMPRVISREDPDEMKSSWKQGLVDRAPRQDQNIIDQIVSRPKQKVSNVATSSLQAKPSEPTGYFDQFLKWGFF